MISTAPIWRKMQSIIGAKIPAIDSKKKLDNNKKHYKATGHKGGATIALKKHLRCLDSRSGRSV
jgi:hypothetical protein